MKVQCGEWTVKQDVWGKDPGIIRRIRERVMRGWRIGYFRPYCVGVKYFIITWYREE